MIRAIRHVGLVVRNLERSLTFYRDFLGLEVWRQATEEGRYIDSVVGIPNVRLECVKLKAPDGSLLELLQYHSHPSPVASENVPSNRVGCSHVAFTVTDLQATYQALLANGFHCNSAPQISQDGGVRVMYCHDPDGIILELVEESGVWTLSASCRALHSVRGQDERFLCC